MFNYCTTEFEKDITAIDIDLVCSMGYGYNFEDVHVGSEFYIPYSYWCKLSDFRRSNAKNKKKDTLKQCLMVFNHNYPTWKVSDKFKLISKYKFFENKIFGGKYRREHVVIKNLRTKELTLLNDDWIDSFYLFLFDTI